MSNAKGRIKDLEGLLFCFLAAVLIAVAALNIGLYTEPGKILPAELSMRSNEMSENIIKGIDLAVDDIIRIRSGNASGDVWRLLTFVHMDLFFFIALLLPQAFAKTVLLFGFYIRFGLCCSAMYYFMSEHIKLPRFASALLAVMYAFSSQIILTAQFASIMNLAIMMPVVMSAFDSYLRKRTWKAFTLVCLSSFGLGITGGYAMTIAIPAMILIGLLMVTGLYKTFKMAMTSWLKIMEGFIFGLVMTAAFSVPGLYAMKFSVDISESLLNAKVSYTLYDLLRGTYLLRSGSFNQSSSPLFYVGLFTLIALLSFALNETIPMRFKVFSAVLLAVFHICACSTFVNEVISTFGTDPKINAVRMICLEVLVFFIAAIGLKNIKSLKRGEFIALFLIPLAFMVVSNNSTSGTTLAAPILVTTFVAFIVEAFLVYALAKGKLTHKAKCVILILIYAFVGVNTSFVMFNNTISRSTTDEFFAVTYGDEDVKALLFDDDFDFPALNNDNRYQVVPIDLSEYEFGEAALDDVNFMADSISGENLFDEIIIVPEDNITYIPLGPDRFGLDVGTNELPFKPFTMNPGERLFVYCTSVNGAMVSINTDNVSGARVFTGPFLTEIGGDAGEVKLEISIESDGEDACYIAVFKLNEQVLNEMKSFSGEINSSNIMINSSDLKGKCTLILPYAFDNTEIRVDGIKCETFDFMGKLAVAFEAKGGDITEVTIERKATGLVPGIMISAFVALCLIAIPISQRYNEKKKVIAEGNSNNA